MQRWINIIAGTIAVTVAACAVYYPFSPRAVQARHMRIAETFIPTARASLSNDHRFEHVKLFSFTAGEGGLGIGGAVRTGDLAEFKKRINGTSPPVEIFWLVKEYDEPLFTNLVQELGDSL